MSTTHSKVDEATIVVLSGRQGSGKTTTSKALIKRAKELGFDHAINVKFADPLYVLHDYILNRMERFTELPRVEKDGVLLQLLGTEWGRAVFGPDVWVNITRRFIEEKLELFHNSKVLFIIDDCRFENEFEAFPNALKVRLEADESVRRIRTESWRNNSTHPSEISLDNYANSGRFDLYISTEDKYGVEHSVSLIMAQIQKDSFKEKRRDVDLPEAQS